MSAAKGKPESPPEPKNESVAGVNLVVVVMVRASRGAKPGDTRAVDHERAAELVGAGLAKYAS